MTQCGAIIQPIVQVHATRHCNLRCKHCYSASGPKERDLLCPETIIRFLGEAREQGYVIVSFSGGEPLVYPHFFRCALAAADMGLKVTVTTNGMLIDSTCARQLACSVDLVAISLDGPPDLHNAMRGSAASFNGAARGMRLLRDAGVRFGIIHTVTESSLPHLRWLYEFAAEEGASLLQLHPLELSGRAAEEMQGDVPNSNVLTRAFLLSRLLTADGDCKLRIQFDLFTRTLIESRPEIVFADELTIADDSLLSKLVNPLVLEESGDVVPLAYGFGRAFRVCNVLRTSVQEAMPHFRVHSYPRFKTLCRTLRNQIMREDDMLYLNWYDAVTRLSCAVDGDALPVPIGGVG
jgi:pyruvate-formate lyase-activating enzyme